MISIVRNGLWPAILDVQWSSCPSNSQSGFPMHKSTHCTFNCRTNLSTVKLYFQQSIFVLNGRTGLLKAAWSKCYVSRGALSASPLMCLIVHQLQRATLPNCCMPHGFINAQSLKCHVSLGRLTVRSWRCCVSLRFIAARSPDCNILRGCMSAVSMKCCIFVANIPKCRGVNKLDSDLVILELS